MKLALLRHGIAEDEAETDFARRLTPEGRAEIGLLVQRLADEGWRPGAILHSPLVRAASTAEVVHQRFPAVPRQVVEDIAYGDLPAILYAASGWANPVIVGHEPTLSRLAARLLGAPPGTFVVERGGFALFELDRLPPERPGKLLRLCAPPRREALG